jgi:hypothetical protein
MLSEFLLSLQSGGAPGAGYAHSLFQQQQHQTSAATPAPRVYRRSAAAAGGKGPNGRRTVVHRRKRRDDLAGPCNHCGALTSPQWRKGPKGKPVLCNACGIRFLRNRTLTKVMVSFCSLQLRGHAAAAAVVQFSTVDSCFGPTLELERLTPSCCCACPSPLPQPKKRRHGVAGSKRSRALAAASAVAAEVSLLACLTGWSQQQLLAF